MQSENLYLINKIRLFEVNVEVININSHHRLVQDDVFPYGKVVNQLM